MKIEHIGLWTADLEKMKEFYCDFFKATAGEKYHNQKSGFQSYFLSFTDGARLEIIEVPGRGECLSCGKNVEIGAVFDPCPACGGYPVHPTEGTEMRVRELEVD